jgi:hypothetical protein
MVVGGRTVTWQGADYRRIWARGCERCEPLAARPVGARPADVLLDQPARDRRRQQRVAAGQYGGRGLSNSEIAAARRSRNPAHPNSRPPARIDSGGRVRDGKGPHCGGARALRLVARSLGCVSEVGRGG